ncbi:MAG: DUF2934 domain-containing protein [Candidatus Binataceae bacterium]
MATTRKTPRKTSGKRTIKNVNGMAATVAESTPTGNGVAAASPADPYPHSTNGNPGVNGAEHELGPRVHGVNFPGQPLEPSFEQIQLRAYQLFLARGGVHGEDMNDWFAAERELRRTAAND